MTLKKKRRSGVKKRRKAGPAKRLAGKVTKAVAERKAATAERKAAADDALQSAIRNGVKSLTADQLAAINADSRTARKVNEEAAVQAAAEYGVDIRKANGKIDTRLARKAAEIAAIRSAAELGVDITNSRGKISRRKALQAARLVEDARAGKPVSAQVSAAVQKQDAALAEAVRDAQRRGFSLAQLGLDSLQGNAGLAQRIDEEAVLQFAKEHGINIQDAEGKMDRKMYRQLERDLTIQNAAELGIDITNSRGKISRRKAQEAAQLAERARAGRPVDAQIADAISRQDARLFAAIKAAERRGDDPAHAGLQPSRRDALNDAELAALVRRSI